MCAHHPKPSPSHFHVCPSPLYSLSCVHITLYPNPANVCICFYDLCAHHPIISPSHSHACPLPYITSPSHSHVCPTPYNLNQPFQCVSITLKPHPTVLKCADHHITTPSHSQVCPPPYSLTQQLLLNLSIAPPSLCRVYPFL